MNSKILSLALFSIFFATYTTHSQTDPFAAQPEKEQSPRMVRVLAEFIEMPLETYTSLMATPSSSTDDSKLRAQCAKLVQSGDAKIIETMSVNAIPGQNATTENITEFIYPTEHEPNNFNQNPALLDGLSNIPIGGPPAPPVAFDTKNLGSTMEVLAQIKNNSRIVELFVTTHIVSHVAKDVWSTWTNDDLVIETSMPRFHLLVVETGATLITGQPQMIAALAPKNENGWTDHSRKIMTFVRADIIQMTK